MDRREFLKKGFCAGVAAGFVNPLARVMRAFATEDSEICDLVAVKGGEPSIMFDKAIESLGGMQNFVKKGQRVVVKPNIGWDRSPEFAANTNPSLVKRIVEQCYAAGARQVYVFDNTCDDWSACYENSRIGPAVKEAGGTMVPGNSEGNYHEVEVKAGTRLRKTKVHELILSSDVFINVPILKHHASTKMTSAMKNLMGMIWDRRYFHHTDLNQCIADLATFRKPDLNIIDAYRALRTRGPRGVSQEDVVLIGTLVATPDIVTADAASAKLLGLELEQVPYIAMAAKTGVGRLDLDKVAIRRIKI